MASIGALVLPVLPLRHPTVVVQFLEFRDSMSSGYAGLFHQELGHGIGETRSVAFQKTQEGFADVR
jgi:hypothetical protein